MVTAETPAPSAHCYSEDAVRACRARGRWRDGSAASLVDHRAATTPARRFVSDGTPALDGVEITLIGPDGRAVATGEEGEIRHRGPGGVLGYWRDPERTAATIDADGWHHTGDPGRVDEHGYLRVCGRLEDIIIRGGTNISAAEVEGYVAAHPSVAQVAVLAYPDERLGEKVCAVVVPAPGAGPSCRRRPPARSRGSCCGSRRGGPDDLGRPSSPNGGDG